MVVATICKLMLAVGAGFFLSRKGIFNGEINQKLSYFIINICLPLLIVVSMNGTEDMDKGEFARYILTGICFYLVLPFFSKLLNIVTRVDKEDRPIYEAFYLFSNNTFLGYHIAASLYGNSCIFHLIVFNLGFDLMYYTYGMRLFDRSGEEREKLSLKKMINPGVVASLAAVIFFFFDIRLPQGVEDACSFLGDLASPLSMVVIGSTIGAYPLKDLFRGEKRLYFVSFVRLILLPAITYGVMTLLGYSGILRGIAVISMAMPVAAMVSMGCVEHEYNEKLGTAGVIVTTTLSLLTIPALLAIPW